MALLVALCALPARARALDGQESVGALRLDEPCPPSNFTALKWDVKDYKTFISEPWYIQKQVRTEGV